MPPLTAAIIGTGFIGPVHVEALRRLGIPIAGVLGSTHVKSIASAENLRVPRAYHSLDELLADPSVGVVHVTSPNRFHFDQCRRIIEAGKHVVCEKPLAMTARETAELVNLARSRPLAAAVCYNTRFYPLNLEAKARLASLGRVFHVTGSYVQDWLLDDTDFNWRVLAGEGGTLRAVTDIGTHWMDLVSFILGQRISAVCADLQTVHPVRQAPVNGRETFAKNTGPTASTMPVAIDTEDAGSVLLRFDGGARGVMTVSQVTAGRKNCLRYEIAAAAGAIGWNSERPDELWLGHRHRPNEQLPRDPSLLSDAARRHADYPGGHNEGFPDTFKQLFRAVYDYIAAGDFSAAKPFPTFADGHHEAAVCAAVLRSSRESRWVSVESVHGGQR